MIPILGCLAPIPASAAQSSSGAAVQSATGVVEGRVQNAVTGRYVSHARVSVAQTDQMVFTDESGYYRLTRVRGGPAVIEVFFTGMETQRTSVTVPAGGNVTQNVSLTILAQQVGQDGTVKLDPFLVGAFKTPMASRSPSTSSGLPPTSRM